MNPKQSRFVREYLIDLDATQAAIRAGYSAHTAAVQGCRLLRHVQVRAAIAKGEKKKEQRSDITQERVLAELKELAFSNVDDYALDASGRLAPAPGRPESVMRAVSSVKYRTTRGKDAETVVEFKLWDKPGTLKLAGRHVGLFPDKVEVTGPNGGPIKVDKVEVVFVEAEG